MKRVLLDNLGWKLLSLGLAFLLWLTFVSTPEVATSMSAAVQLQDIPSDLEIVSMLPERVQLQIQGSAAKLGAFDLSGMAVVLSLRDVHGAGERTYTIDYHTVRLPFGVRLIRAVPGQLHLVFERRTSREVPVRVRFSRPPPHPYHVRHQEVQPPRLTILGPESRVREVEFAETDPIELPPKAGQSEFRVNAFVRDPQVRFGTPPVVRVKVTLEVSGGGRN